MRAVSLAGLAIITCLVLTACSTQPVTPIQESSTHQDRPDQSADETEKPNTPNETEKEKQECFFERIKGVVEIIKWHEDKASLLFYPGEIPLSISRDNIQPYIQAGQSEIKALLKKPLNQHCGKPEISIYSSIE